MPRADLVATARGVGAYAAMAGRLARDLPPFLRRPLSVDVARERVRAGLAQREARFLDLVDRVVYRQPRSPYRQLLAHAGCEPGDLRTMVRGEGLEGALGRLADAGVYVTFDEFKGRQPVIRGSARFSFSDRDFDSPSDPIPHYVDYTGGSSGRPTPVPRTLGAMEEVSVMVALIFEAHGISQPHHLFWRGGSPSLAIIHLKLGATIDRWIYPVQPLPLLSRLGLLYVGGLARLARRRMPWPRYGDLQRPELVAQWLVSHPPSDGSIVVSCTISSAVRVASAAASLGRSLDGVTFYVYGEPLSERRRGVIEASGAGVLPNYSSNEFPMIGAGCPAGSAPDDVHVMTHLYAVIERERELFVGGPSVDALLFTTLSPTATKIAINVEIGDAGRLEQRRCGCRLEALGLRTHLSEIRSFEKLSAEGTTFFRTSLMKILEETLPASFGGEPVDYQLVEVEGEDGSGQLVLRIDPNVGPLDEDAVRAMLLAELRRGDVYSAFHAELVERAGAISVRRLPPLATPAGKVLPFYLARSTMAQ
jgi:phenylacetate-coenzyme A ligase PaaK-like adenylate-forming protein